MGKFAIAARVLRISGKGRTLRVAFESLSETDRNRIMTFIFRRPERPQAGSA
jgi:hypothetical protein